MRETDRHDRQTLPGCGYAVTDGTHGTHVSVAQPNINNNNNNNNSTETPTCLNCSTAIETQQHDTTHDTAKTSAVCSLTFQQLQTTHMLRDITIAPLHPPPLAQEFGRELRTQSPHIPGPPTFLPCQSEPVLPRAQRSNMKPQSHTCVHILRPLPFREKADQWRIEVPERP
jgi:hypothetical protein